MLTLLRRTTNYWRNPRGTGAVPGTPGTFPANWSFYSGNPSGGVQGNLIGQGFDGNWPYTDVQFVGTGVGSSLSALVLESSSAVPSKQGQTWTFACPLKIVAGSLNGASIYLEISEWNSVGGILTGSDASVTVPSTGALAANLCTYTYTTTNASCAYAQPDINWSISNGVAYNYTLRIGAGFFVPGRMSPREIAQAFPPVGLPNFSQGWQ